MMKVMVSQESKKYLTAEEYDNAKRLAKHMKEEDDEWGATDYAKLAVRGAGGDVVEILKASATVMGNTRAYDIYFEGSGRLDIWIETTALTAEGFVIVGAYLSDIYSITGTDDKDFQRHAFIRRFKEVK